MHKPYSLPGFAAMVALVSGLGLPARGQNFLPNPGFELGNGQPAGWRVEGGSGEWSQTGWRGKRSVAVVGTGQDSAVWRTARFAVQPGAVYRLSFFARRDADASGGCAVAGTSRINRDFHFTESWAPYSFVFRAPEDGTNDYVRLGQWHLKGRLYFDEVEVVPVRASHGERFGAGKPRDVLGEGESVERGRYRFDPNFGWEGANYHRPLWRHRGNFNSDRWVFGPGSEVVYHFQLAGLQTNATVRVAINYYESGALRVEASRDAREWLTVAVYDGAQRGGTTNLPARLFPAPSVYMRLSLEGGSGNLQVNSFAYETALSPGLVAARGVTRFLDIVHASAELPIDLEGLAVDPGRRQATCSLAVRNATGKPLTVRGWTTNDAAVSPAGTDARLGPFQRTNLGLTCTFSNTGPQVLHWALHDQDGRALFVGRSTATLGFLYDPRPGYYVAGKDDLDVWWCESGWKIGRRLLLPQRPANRPIQPVSVSAARGEYEAVQVVLRPSRANEVLNSAAAGPLLDAKGEPGPITVRVDEVVYVEVTRPTDRTGERDGYPDPLPPLQPPLPLVKNENKLLWLTFWVPRETRPGDYSGQLRLSTSAGDLRVPLAVHVYDFELPRETHLRSALGLGAQAINRHHRLTDRQQRETVYEKYLRNFAEHRISPYSFFTYAPMDIRFAGQGAEKQAVVDFARFDAAAAKWLDEEGFTSFLLPLRGMGGGTFHSRHLGELEGFKEGTPEHARLFQDYLGQIERHLKEKGWLNKAYTYWFDEPDPKDYQFVVEGMKRLKAAAPGLKRLLTEQPEPALFGQVDIWCGLTPEWTPEKVRARRAAGEEVWWYICCAPHAPYVTEFIDHPGTELRLWPWQSWQYGVQGLLIWETVYWTSSAAFPAPQMQDPWEDPMSYVSGYDFKPGHIGYWGNGDGRFLYPPRGSPTAKTEPCRDGPVNSFRWENLRDGIEDYEYLWLLQQAVERLSQMRGETDLVKQARRLLEVPETVSKDLTHFTTDPRQILAHRDKVARMLERLR